MTQNLENQTTHEEDLSKKIDQKFSAQIGLSGEAFYIPIVTYKKNIYEYEESIEKLKFKGTETKENYFFRANLDFHFKVPVVIYGSSGMEIVFPSKLDSIGDFEDVHKFNRINELNKKLFQYSKNIIGLPENWNGEDSSAIKEEYWENTENLVRKILYSLWDQALNIPIPLILPNTDASFDIDWQTDEFELLINVPPSKLESVHIYGEKINSPENELEVRINYELAHGVIIEWLKKIL